MNVLWIKCTSHGRGYIYKLEDYIVKNREVNLIGNLEENVPHNTMSFTLHDEDVYYKNTKINLETIHQAVFIFAYKIENIDVDFDGRQAFDFDSNRYIFFAVGLDDYSSFTKRRSPKWQTLTLPADKFRQCAVHIEQFLLCED